MSTTPQQRTEVWKAIPGHPYYEASSLGRLRSTDKVVRHNWGGLSHKKGKILAQSLNHNGYPISGLTVEGRVLRTAVHRLVAFAFLGQPDSSYQVNHKDGNKLNNTPENLEWVTPAQNVAHAWANGLAKPYARSAAGREVTGKRTARAVIQRAPTGEFIKEFPTTKAAAEAFGVKPRSIYFAISKGCKLAKFTWTRK